MRFINEDTNKGDMKNPLSLNLYTYCYGNPLKYYDPSGHTGELAAGWFGSMWWLLAADGPIPIGDAIYLIGGGLVYAGEQLVTYGPQLVAAADKIKDKIGNSSSGDQDPNNKNRNDISKKLSKKDLLKNLRNMIEHREIDLKDPNGNYANMSKKFGYKTFNISDWKKVCETYIINGKQVEYHYVINILDDIVISEKAFELIDGVRVYIQIVQ